MMKILTIPCAMMALTLTAQVKPLKVYILVGQSNMQGHAQMSTVPYMKYDAKTKGLHDKIVDAGGNPRVYDHVRIAAYSEAGQGNEQTKSGPLTMGYGAALTSDSVCGPELAFGITMGEQLGEPILLIKTAWGGKSLNTDFRPPGAGPYKLPKEIQERWDKYPDGAHGIPSQAQRKEWWEKKNAATGHYYRLMVKHVQDTLADIKKYYPGYDEKQGYEIAGMVWFQGWNDMCDGTTYPDSKIPGGYAEYSELMSHFIRDVRKDLSAPDMPFVIGVIGVGGEKSTGGIANLRPAMAAPAAMDEFKGTVAAVETAPFWDYRMAELEGKRGQVQHRLQAGHVVGADGTMEPRDTEVPGWQLVGSPARGERVWRFTSVTPSLEKEQLDKKEKKRYRQITLPDALQGWYKPGFDDNGWQSGQAPIGKGTWKFRNYPEVKLQSTWRDGEFLLMRTTFDVDELDYVKYRISILARQGFHVYLNGEKIHTYIWWRDEPVYRAIELEDKYAKLLKKGPNVLAVYANCEYDRKTGADLGAVDIMIEGITEEGLAYVNSEEYKLRLMDKECTREEGRIILGMSNGGYHYLGSAKILNQIGEAFAKAMMNLHEKHK